MGDCGTFAFTEKTEFLWGRHSLRLRRIYCLRSGAQAEFSPMLTPQLCSKHLIRLFGEAFPEHSDLYVGPQVIVFYIWHLGGFFLEDSLHFIVVTHINVWF